jgi:lysophospholipase L1-like esterase
MNTTIRRVVEAAGVEPAVRIANQCIHSALQACKPWRANSALLLLLFASPVAAQTITVQPSATPGAAITVTVTSGPGQPLDWVGLYVASAPDQGNYLQYQFMNGTHNPPTSGRSSAVLQFTAPAEGVYNVRWFANGGYTPIAFSTPITVTQAPVPLPGGAFGVLVVAGDSNTAANSYVTGGENWAVQVATGLGMTLENRAVSGWYSDGVLLDLPAMAARNGAVCLVQIGTNDMAAAVQHGTPAPVALAGYVTNMRAIIVGLKPACGKVVILSPPFVGHRREVARYPAWSNALQSLTAELGVVYLDLFRHMQGLADHLTVAQFDSWYLVPSADPWHLSPTGHAVVSSFVLSHLPR